MKGIYQTEFHFPNQTGFYRGKVRDVYYIADKYLLMLATDRLSAFDVVMPSPIPYKGQVLNEIAWYFLKKTEDLVPNWTLAMPDPNITLGISCRPLEVEMVVRGYLAGHAWRTYKAGTRILCGVPLPEGLKENDALPHPIITPSTKAKVGHDEDISREEILRRGIVTESQYAQMEAYAISLYKRGQNMARERGLILVDTKYEFGWHDGQVYLIDEIHTPDSSRYFYLDGYKERQAAGIKQKQLSKEFVREWLIENNFMGKEGQQIPAMSDDFIASISARYIALYEIITGQKFIPQNYEDASSRIAQHALKTIEKLP